MSYETTQNVCPGKLRDFNLKIKSESRSKLNRFEFMGLLKGIISDLLVTNYAMFVMLLQS